MGELSLINELNPLLEEQGATLIQPPSNGSQITMCGESLPIDAVNISVSAEQSGRTQWNSLRTEKVVVAYETVREWSVR